MRVDQETCGRLASGEGGGGEESPARFGTFRNAEKILVFIESAID